MINKSIDSLAIAIIAVHFVHNDSVKWFRYNQQSIIKFNEYIISIAKSAFIYTAELTNDIVYELVNKWMNELHIPRQKKSYSA